MTARRLPGAGQYTACESLRVGRAGSPATGPHTQRAPDSLLVSGALVGTAATQH